MPYFLPYQRAWLNDSSPLKLMQKSRQIGATFTDAYDSVRKASLRNSGLDVWVSSRDKQQARLYLEDCQHWASILKQAADPLGQIVFDTRHGFSAYVLEFANGRRIFSLSSNPNALAGKRGHVKLDEFALHRDQRLLFQVAKPVTQWGGQLCLLSTHRGAQTLFNQFIGDIIERGNPMGWSLHTVPLEKAVADGLVERINPKSGRHETREQFLARTRAECADEEQWLQEYCCTPADESSAFLSYDLILACQDPDLRLLDIGELLHALGRPATGGSAGRGGSQASSFYLGVDVARKHDLCVFDVGERIGDVVWDRLRLELRNRPFSEIQFELYRLLRLERLKRCCIDATGLGLQLAEEAQARFGWKVEPITFTAAVKEELAFGLRKDFEDRCLRIADDDELCADLRGIKKEVTQAGNLRFAGESPDSHCDRFWAKALRQHAAHANIGAAATVG